MVRVTCIKARDNTSICINSLALTIALAIKPEVSFIAVEATPSAQGASQNHRLHKEAGPPHKKARWVDEVDEILTQWTSISQELPPDEAAAMEASIFSAMSEAWKEDDVRSRVLDMMSQAGPSNNFEVSVLHDVLPCASTPSRSMLPEKSDPHMGLDLGRDFHVYPVSDVHEPSGGPNPQPLQMGVRDVIPAEAANNDRVESLKAIRCALQYIARCYEANQSADPGSNMYLCSCYKMGKSSLALKDIRICIFFEPILDFKLLRLLLTAWHDQMPAVQLSSHNPDEKKHQSVVYWLMHLLESHCKLPSLTAKQKTRKYRTWMLLLMQKLGAEAGPITPGVVVQLLVKELEKKYDWWRLCETGAVDPDDWIPDVPLKSLTTAGRGAAKLLRLFARCPLDLLSDRELSSCLQSLETAYASPVNVCERIWHKTVFRTRRVQAGVLSRYKEPRHWADNGPTYNPSPGSTALCSVTQENFWARVSWLFQHKFASVANRVKTVWSLPHERQNAMDIVDIAAALDTCVAEAFNELSCNVRLRDGIQLASVCDIVPAMTLLKTQEATLALPSDLRDGLN
eukprot:Blabericola_migrator_1__604@NODE_1148_length_5275_cov_33_353303_g782_i0_p2_GENE_NODE_1148_length_5275_cov_33_353303_g782_i0NODE_1148_length_5275_cov_33_353303_g782_i0_p2_ORF_typecomplete_len570_score93_65_NODE_1148_length_5275_cov_33_353303_g782_i024734182